MYCNLSPIDSPFPFSLPLVLCLFLSPFLPLFCLFLYPFHYFSTIFFPSSSPSPFSPLPSLPSPLSSLPSPLSSPLSPLPSLPPHTQSDMDDRREVSNGEGVLLSQQLKCPFFETSAKLRINIDECFHELVREIKICQAEQNKLAQDSPSGKTCCVLL